MENRPIVLVILDGWGYAKKKLGNAILNASTPMMDMLRTYFPGVLLQASGPAVGLTWGEPGNSEVGHLTIGAGRNIFHYSSKITQAIEKGPFFENEAFLGAINHVKTSGSSLHISGLLGSGTAHSNYQHLIALIDLARKHEVRQIRLHLFTDGKDSGLKESPMLIGKLQNYLKDKPDVVISSIMGRYYPMDRDHNWHRTETAYNLLVSGYGYKTPDILAAIEGYYRQGFTDTDLPPIVALPQVTVQDNDSMIFFNFREDSMRQIGTAFTEPEFKEFPRTQLKNVFVVFMTQYFASDAQTFHVAFPLPAITNGLAQILSSNGIKQLHIAETEKFAHTTYFFNCLNEKPLPEETDVLIESHKDHLAHPEMRAGEIADRFIQELDKDIYGFTVINIANADILAHKGDLEATVAGVQHLDASLARIYEAVMKKNGILIVTADHGNAESLVYRGSGDMETKHNVNPVPFFLVAREFAHPKTPEEQEKETQDVPGIISDIAPTVLDLLGITRPGEMSGESLLRYLIKQ